MAIVAIAVTLPDMAAPTVLRTERLVLRPFQSSDVEGALSYRDDLEFARFLPHIPQPFSRTDAEAFVALNMSEPWERSPTFAVVLDRSLIGTVNFDVEADTRTAMLGYAIGRAWWGQGIATEAARAAMIWAIETFDLLRIWASTDARNIRSRRVMEKLGMQLEELRAGNQMGRAAEVIDEVVYGLNFTPRGKTPG
jgi:RimJ/RimL family protein N-acetyltransferase